MLTLQNVTMTREETLALFKEGGFDKETFDAVSEKSFEEIFEELSNQEVKLELVPAKNDLPAYIAKCALTIAVRVIAPTEKAKILETKRELRSGNVIEKVRNWTITGTRRRNVCEYTDAIRELKEELGLEVQEAQLSYYSQESPKPYPSSAYPLLMAHSQITLLNCTVDKLPWPEEEKVIQDGYKSLTLKRFPLELDDISLIGPD